MCTSACAPLRRSDNCDSTNISSSSGKTILVGGDKGEKALLLSSVQPVDLRLLCRRRANRTARGQGADPYNRNARQHNIISEHTGIFLRSSQASARSSVRAARSGDTYRSTRLRDTSRIPTAHASSEPQGIMGRAGSCCLRVPRHPAQRAQDRHTANARHNDIVKKLPQTCWGSAYVYYHHCYYQCLCDCC